MIRVAVFCMNLCVLMLYAHDQNVSSIQSSIKQVARGMIEGNKCAERAVQSLCSSNYNNIL